MGVLIAASRGGAWSGRKYTAACGIAIRQALSERAALVGRTAFYVLILLVFSRLWAAVGARIEIPGATMREMVWYLAITEWIVLAQPPIHLKIAEDVRRGDIAYQLPRPISYLGSCFAQAWGDFTLRALALGVTGFAMASWMTGGLPQDPSGLTDVRAKTFGAGPGRFSTEKQLSSHAEGRQDGNEQNHDADSTQPLGQSAPEKQAAGHRLDVIDDGRTGGRQATHRLEETRRVRVQ